LVTVQQSWLTRIALLHKIKVKVKDMKVLNFIEAISNAQSCELDPTNNWCNCQSVWCGNLTPPKFETITAIKVVISI
jgi:hypothetical protein